MACVSCESLRNSTKHHHQQSLHFELKKYFRRISYEPVASIITHIEPTPGQRHCGSGQGALERNREWNIPAASLLLPFHHHVLWRSCMRGSWEREINVLSRQISTIQRSESPCRSREPRSCKRQHPVPVRRRYLVAHHPRRCDADTRIRA
mgnify:CR=1 FL=1